MVFPFPFPTSPSFPGTEGPPPSFLVGGGGGGGASRLAERIAGYPQFSSLSQPSLERTHARPLARPCYEGAGGGGQVHQMGRIGQGRF